MGNHFILPSFNTCPFGWNSYDRTKKVSQGKDTFHTHDVKELTSSSGSLAISTDKKPRVDLENQVENDNKSRIAGYIPLLNVVIGIIRIACAILAAIEIHKYTESLLKNGLTPNSATKIKAMRRDQYANMGMQVVRGVAEIFFGPFLAVVDFSIYAYERKALQKEQSRI